MLLGNDIESLVNAFKRPYIIGYELQFINFINYGQVDEVVTSHKSVQTNV